MKQRENHFRLSRQKEGSVESIVWKPLINGPTGKRKPAVKESYFSVRNGSLKLSAGFVEEHRFADRGIRHLLIYVNDEHYLIQINPLTDDDKMREISRNRYCRNIFSLNEFDGGSKNRKRSTDAGRYVNCVAAIKSHKWLRSVAQDKHNSRRQFKVTSVVDHSVPFETYRVQVIPGFCNAMDVEHYRMGYLGVDLDVLRSGKGIYRFLGPAKEEKREVVKRIRRSQEQMHHDLLAGIPARKGETVTETVMSREVLYIGQGAFAERWPHHLREKPMGAEVIEYTPIKDDALRVNAESHHLEAYKATHGRYPQFNLRPSIRPY